MKHLKLLILGICMMPAITLCSAEFDAAMERLDVMSKRAADYTLPLSVRKEAGETVKDLLNDLWHRTCNGDSSVKYQPAARSLGLHDRDRVRALQNEMEARLAEAQHIERTVTARVRKQTVLWILAGAIVAGAVYKFAQWRGWLDKETKPKAEEQPAESQADSAKG